MKDSLNNYLIDNDYFQTKRQKKTVLLAVKKVEEKIRTEHKASRLHVIGSAKMETWLPGDDVDCVCVIPRRTNRAEFFKAMVDLLPKHFKREYRVISNVSVPIISVYCEGHNIDIQFACFDIDKLEPFENISHTDVMETDPESQAGLNAMRNATSILNIVPDHNIFRVLIRAVKVWARNRGIYGNKFGYLGGIACAIMVAKVCRQKQCKNKQPTFIICEFFKQYSNHFNTPGAMVALNKKRLEKPTPGALWKVLTPILPVQDTMARVNLSTKRIIRDEFRRAMSIMSDVDYVEKIILWEKLNEKFVVNKIECSYVLGTVEPKPTEPKLNVKKVAGFIEMKLHLLVVRLHNWFRQIEQARIVPEPEVDRSNLHYGYVIQLTLAKGKVIESERWNETARWFSSICAAKYGGDVKVTLFTDY